MRRADITYQGNIADATEAMGQPTDTGSLEPELPTRPIDTEPPKKRRR